MILDSSSREILERWQAARAEEGEAIKALHAAAVAGERNMERLMQLTKAMEDAHHRSMMIYQELNAVRLDK